jgi:hypothetical protein
MQVDLYDKLNKDIVKLMAKGGATNLNKCLDTTYWLIHCGNFSPNGERLFHEMELLTKLYKLMGTNNEEQLINNPDCTEIINKHKDRKNTKFKELTLILKRLPDELIWEIINYLFL